MGFVQDEVMFVIGDPVEVCLALVEYRFELLEYAHPGVSGTENDDPIGHSFEYVRGRNHFGIGIPAERAGVSIEATVVSLEPSVVTLLVDGRSSRRSVTSDDHPSIGDRIH